MRFMDSSACRRMNFRLSSHDIVASTASRSRAIGAIFKSPNVIVLVCNVRSTSKTGVRTLAIIAIIMLDRQKANACEWKRLERT